MADIPDMQTVVVDGRAQRLAEGYVEDARSRVVGGRGDGRPDAVYHYDGLVGGGQYAVAGRVGDRIGGDVQLRGIHRVDHMALRIRERQGQGRVGMVDGPGGDTTQREIAWGLAGVPDGDTIIVDGRAQRLAEGHVEDARPRIVI